MVNQYYTTSRPCLQHLLHGLLFHSSMLAVVTLCSRVMACLVWHCCMSTVFRWKNVSIFQTRLLSHSYVRQRQPTVSYTTCRRYEKVASDCEQLCWFSLLLDRNVRWPRPLLPPGKTRYADGTNR